MLSVEQPNIKMGRTSTNPSHKSMHRRYKSLTVFCMVCHIMLPRVSRHTQFMATLLEARENHEWLRYEFPPTNKPIPLGDVFTSCNWTLRDGYVSRVVFSTIVSLLQTSEGRSSLV